MLPERLNVLAPREAEGLDLPSGSVDVVFSIAVLEHIPRPRIVLDNVFRMLKPGGWTYHSIDLRDHGRALDAPLDFLRLSPEEFANLPPSHLNRGGNRYRLSDYEREVRDAGFVLAHRGLCGPHTITDGFTDNYDMAQRPLTETFVEHLNEVRGWVTPADREALHPDFQGYGLDELSVTGLEVVAVKPATPRG